jgi:hypothetical protein
MERIIDAIAALVWLAGWTIVAWACLWLDAR